MKKQLVMLSLACISFGSLASNPHYFSADNRIESKLCSLSANEGFTAARKEAAKHGISMSRFSKSILCNGTDIREIAKKAQIVYGDLDKIETIGADVNKGAFISPILLREDNPFKNNAVHEK